MTATTAIDAVKTLARRVPRSATGPARGWPRGWPRPAVPGPQALALIYALVLAGLVLALTARALPALAAGSQVEGTPVALRSSIEVDGRYVTLGDLFHPIGETDAGRAVARAPKPGQRLTLEAVWLWRVAKRYGVDWRPTSKLDTATVSRPSRVVSSDTIRGLVREAYFEATGEDELVRIALDESDAQLHLARSTTGSARLARFDLDRRSGRFTAVVTGPDTEEGRRTLTLGGKAVRLVEVPTPVARIPRGEIIGERDLAYERLPAAQVSRSAVLDAARLVGKQARRTLSAGRPVQDTGIQPPELVRKDAVVTIVLQTDNMRLTAQGRALESGAREDMVRVRNTQSNVTIDTVVTGDNRVTVVMPERLAARQANGE